MLLDDDGEHVYTVSEDYTILKWKVPYMDFEVKLEGHVQEIKKLVYSHKRNLIYSTSYDRIVIIWDFEQKIKEIINESDIRDIEITNDEKYLVACLSSKDMVFWDLDVFQDYHIYFEDIMDAILISPCGKFIISGDVGGRITIKNYDSPISGINSPPIAVVKHDCQITALAIANDSSLVFGGDLNGYISVFDMAHQTKNDPAIHHKDTIYSLKVSNDNKILISGYSASPFIIWNINNSKIEKSIELGSNENGIDFYFSKTKNYFVALSSENGMTFWDYKTFTKLATVPIEAEGLSYSITCSPDEKYIIFSAADDVIVKENPMEAKGIYLYGHEFCATDFMAYLRKIILYENPEYNPEMDGWFITPIFWNVGHIYAYFNLADHLHSFLENSGSLIVDRRGLSPLDISIAKRNFDCVEIIISEFLRNINYSQRINTIENSLTALNLYGCRSLNKLYERILIKSNSDFLQKRCLVNQKLPMIVLSKNSEITNGEFNLKEGEDNEETKEIEFYCSKIMLNLNIGSEESIKFMESMIKCPNKKIIDTEIFYYIINYKWEKLKWTMRFIYFLYFAISWLFAFTFLSYMKGNLEFYYCQFFNLLITIFDAYLLVKTNKNKQITMWNDYSYIRLYLFPLILLLGNWEINYSLLVLISLLKSVSVFQLFENTRNIIFSLQFILDILGNIFLNFIFLSVASAFWEIFVGDWLLKSMKYLQAPSIGNDESIPNPLNIAVVLILGFIIQILLVNSLIAIIRKNYPKFLYHCKYNEKQCLAEIILEGEKLWPFKCKNEKHYIHVCDFRDHEDLELYKYGSIVNEITDNLKSCKYIVSSKNTAGLGELNQIKAKIDEKKVYKEQNKIEKTDMLKKLEKLGEINEKIVSLQNCLKEQTKPSS
ncbi:unnamed protein product [Blepharisma stoltei]|uniref:Ion transport domain-containing protein n=1 Tax=Blepharisma stoltei TaxID=1481888 RepID=A0AAU9K4P8_9CILI|nr:unnamed protein product [Blepharisma stoltei]